MNIKISNGDIVFSPIGRMLWVGGVDSLIQSIYLKLNTLRGDLFYDDNYGHPLFKGKLTKDALELYLQETLIDNDEIYDVIVDTFEEVKGRLNKGRYNVTALITINEGEILTITYSI